jgi:CheY-like chemotaxis protein
MRQILVVDDDLLTRTTLTIILEEAGYTVLTASDGTEALDMIDAQLPDLLISDIRLPRLNGIQLLARLRSFKQTYALPVLLTSASTRPTLKNIDRCIFLEKPIGIDLLLRTVGELLKMSAHECALGGLDPPPRRLA